jgi:hypothetical protein
MEHPPSPQTIAFGTTEILELILSQLDLRTLLTTAQLTCRKWTNVIRNSPPLQQALFFTPIRGSQDIERVQNPLLADSFSPWFPRRKVKDIPRELPYRYKHTFGSLDMIRNPAKRMAYLRKEASWRRMLTYQPPKLGFAFFATTIGMGGVGCTLSKIQVSLPLDSLYIWLSNQSISRERINLQI